jgi:GNAT superfamily N-acetyltransferase
MPDPVTIRPAVPADADTLVRFNLRMARETEDKQLDPAVLASGVEAVLRDPALGFYRIADLEGKAVGSLLVTFEWSDWRNGTFWWVQSVYVEPEHRRRGVFRALYEDVRKQATSTPRVCGCRLYVERDNAAAQATYARLGMTETNYRLLEELFRP